ncbi:MAG: DsbA family protein [Ilumatobacter sp.]|uniref:DsbA family protein n=1 Tax=Ilumatobacter sp. TaxID=1967498 RepID=UPI0032979B00
MTSAERPSTDLDFFFDPVCPWAWITSRWVVDVQRQRSYTVDWRFISLWILNEENTQDWYTPEYRAGHFLGHRSLRIADQIRLSSDDPEAVGRWYTAVGEALHRDDRRREARDDNQAFLSSVLAAAGFDPELIAHADDDSHDAHIRSDTELALSRTGPDVGTPILSFRPGTEREGSFFGPVISQAPTGVEAIELWDAVEKLAVSGVAELKRSNRAAPVF